MVDTLGAFGGNDQFAGLPDAVLALVSQNQRVSLSKNMIQ